MVRITEKLVRKKSEHNELLISTLEELSLHQENIEKIENIQNWCRDLKILLLQSNLISKIENLHKLKNLEYLNLGLNNIERIENLEQLESLKKLDLTLNFIGELTSVENLIQNYNLEELTLTGNPCTDYFGYREYVIVILPQLKMLDNIEIKISDRIKASQTFSQNREEIIQFETEYKIKRDEQKLRVEQELLVFNEELNDITDEEERLKRFWNTKTEHCPEIRYEISKQQQKSKNSNTENDKIQEKRQIKLFAPCGRPYNLNQPQIKFQLLDENDRYELNLQVYKFLDTSLIEIDLQPNYIRVIIKTKVFQLALNDEINLSNSYSKRSQITGHLLIWMPKLNPKKIFLCNKNSMCRTEGSKEDSNSGKRDNNNNNNLKGTVNYKDIVKTTSGKNLPFSSSKNESLLKDFNQEEIPDLV